MRYLILRLTPKMLTTTRAWTGQGQESELGDRARRQKPGAREQGPGARSQE